jgi:hypothetical protein
MTPSASAGAGEPANVHRPSAAASTRGALGRCASGTRFHTPLTRITSAEKVQTMTVSMKGSSPATMPSRTGSRVRAAECTMGEEPWPASFE